jgi:hypothetical protein
MGGKSDLLGMQPKYVYTLLPCTPKSTDRQAPRYDGNPSGTVAERPKRSACSMAMS